MLTFRTHIKNTGMKAKQAWGALYPIMCARSTLPPNKKLKPVGTKYTSEKY